MVITGASGALKNEWDHMMELCPGEAHA